MQNFVVKNIPSVLSVTNTVVGYMFGHENLCSFSSPERENFRKHIVVLRFREKISKSTNKVRKPKIYYTFSKTSS